MAEGIFQKIKMEASFWLGRRLPTCKELTVWMSESLERKLSLRQRIKLKLHMMICVWCQRYQEHLYFLRETAQNYAQQVEEKDATTAALSPEVRERLKALLRRHEK